MPGTVLGSVDHLIAFGPTGSNQEAFTSLFKFLNGPLRSSSYVELVALQTGSAQTGVPASQMGTNYHDKINPFGENAFACFRWRSGSTPFGGPSTRRAHDYYMLLQWSYNTTFGNAPGNPGRCYGGTFGVGISIAWREDGGNPWGGTTMANGNDSKGSTVWVSGASVVHSFPRSNNPGGTHSTLKENTVGYPTSVAVTSRIHYVADRDSLMMVGDDCGGGSGYWGGGGGSGDGRGGGGGSGFIHPTRVTFSGTTAGSNGNSSNTRANPPMTTDIDYLTVISSAAPPPYGVGTGGHKVGSNGTDGGHGFVLLRYTTGQNIALWFEDDPGTAYITSSVAIGVTGSAQNNAGQEAFLFVSGTIGISGSSARKSIFGGDVVSSGSLSTTSDYVTYANRPSPKAAGQRIFIRDSGINEWVSDGSQWRPLIQGTLGYQPLVSKLELPSWWNQQRRRYCTGNHADRNRQQRTSNRQYHRCRGKTSPVTADWTCYGRDRLFRAPASQQCVFCVSADAIDSARKCHG